MDRGASFWRLRVYFFAGICLIHLKYQVYYHNDVYYMPMKVKVSGTQPCLALCDPMDCSPTRLLCPWYSPARILEWLAIPFSRGSF